jgi:hypothetical protein
MGRIGGIEKLKEFDEFAAAMAIPDQGVNLTGEQIDAGQQADCAVTFVFMIAREGCMGSRLGCRHRNRLDLVIVGEQVLFVTQQDNRQPHDRNREAAIALRFFCHNGSAGRTSTPLMFRVVRDTATPNRRMRVQLALTATVP